MATINSTDVLEQELQKIENKFPLKLSSPWIPIWDLVGRIGGVDYAAVEKKIFVKTKKRRPKPNKIQGLGRRKNRA